MSAPPAYSTPPATNPDRRPLPDGYITRYDENYRAWYYVWTRSDPPRSSWTHPLDSQPQSQPQGNFSPPPNPPPPDRTPYSSGGGGGGGGRPYPPQPASVPFTQAASGQQPWQSSPFPGGGGGGGFPDNTNTRYAQTQGYQTQPNYGAPSPNYGNQWPNWQQQPTPQQVYVPQAHPPTAQQPARGRRNHGGRGGMGAALLAGGAGLAVGGLAVEAFDHHEDEVAQEAYDQGFDNGFDDGTNFDGNY